MRRYKGDKREGRLTHDGLLVFHGRVGLNFWGAAHHAAAVHREEAKGDGAAPVVAVPAVVKLCLEVVDGGDLCAGSSEHHPMSGLFKMRGEGLCAAMAATFVATGAQQWLLAMCQSDGKGAPTAAWVFAKIKTTAHTPHTSLPPTHCSINTDFFFEILGESPSSPL